MEKKHKIMGLSVIIFLLIGGLMAFQQYRISSVKKELERTVQENIHGFAGVAGNIDEYSYRKQYAHVRTAHEAYVIISDRSGFVEWDESLAGILIQITYLMDNDKEKFQQVFSKREAGELLFKIGDDFEDKDLLHELYVLMKVE